jgi:uncharacterized protein YkwD
MNLQAVRRPVDLQRLDHQLLDAAVFFVSNAYRAQHSLPLFEFEPALRDMAARHSLAMARYGFVNHQNPWEASFRHLKDRCKAFQVEACGENLASALVYVWYSGGYYYPKKTGSRWVYFDGQGEPIPPHSYLSLAQTLVERWYQSPGHRQNLLDPSFRTLGCAVRLPPHRSQTVDMPLAYATQNFGQ